MEIISTLSQRREFLKKGILAGLGLGLMPSLSLANDSVPQPGWNDLKGQFNIPKDYHYFNTGTLGISPKYVIEKYKSAIDVVNSKGIYGQHKKALIAALSDLVSCDIEEIALTHNVTEGINIAAWAVPLKKDDEIILCTHEHAGNIIPWLNRAEKDKLKIKLIELGANGTETLVNLANAVTANTKVIALPHIPCTIGHVLPVKQICKLASSIGAYSCIDGAHGAGMLELDMHDIGCDFYSSCFHKWMLGPKGSGFLFVRKALLPMVETHYAGAYSDQNWSLENAQVQYSGIRTDSAARYAYGTQSDAIHAGSLASIEFMRALGMKKVANHIRKIGKYLCEGLLEIPEIELLVSSNSKETAGIISFKPKNKDYKELTKVLNHDSFRIRMVPESGINCIRISTHLYNSKEDIDLLLSAIKKHV
ncbi:MAG: aminotransferase class V-fold PLP-dependent enzyme [Bacteroidia bacterium]